MARIEDELRGQVAYFRYWNQPFIGSPPKHLFLNPSICIPGPRYNRESEQPTQTERFGKSSVVITVRPTKKQQYGAGDVCVCVCERERERERETDRQTDRQRVVYP